MKNKRRKTHFVPRSVFRSAFAGVVPLCVAGTACGGGDVAVTDAGPDHVVLTVACTFTTCGAVGMYAFSDAATDAASSDATATDAANETSAGDARPDRVILTVACIGFDGGPCGIVTLPPDAASDGASHDASGIVDGHADAAG